MKWVALALVLVVALFFTAGAGQTQGTKRKADQLLQLHSWLWPPRKGGAMPTSAPTQKPTPTPMPTPEKPATPDVPVANNVAPGGSPAAKPMPPAERPKPKPKPKPKAEQQGRERPTHSRCMAKAMFSQSYLEAEGRRRGNRTKAAR